MMKGLSIRWRLTLWYGGVLAALLAIFGTAVYFTMRHHQFERLDRGLAEELSDVLSEIRRAPDNQGLLQWLDRRFAQHEGFDFQISRDDGERFFVSARLADIHLPLPEESPPVESPSYRNVWLDGTGHWRVVSVRAQGPSGMLTVQVARSLAAVEHESRELLATLLLTGPLALLVAVGGGYFLARRALGPVQQITQTANSITADRLSQRISVPNPDDELGALAQTLNRMVERLEQSFTEMQRFTADAAHELRTPLAVIRSEAEVALRAPRAAEEYCQVLTNLLEETNRLTDVAEQLLFLCRQDTGLHPAAQDELVGHELLREVLGNMQPVAQEKGVALVLADGDSCRLVTDSRQLRRVFYNLLDNAIKYTPPAGRVTVSSRIDGATWQVSISDTGIGIEPTHLPHVFERFYRIDAARTGDGGGAGLGLAICRSIIHALGGTIQLESIPGRGTTVRVELPVAGNGKSEVK